MMNTFQFISSVGGAGAPKGNEENEDCKARRKETLFSWLASVQSLLGRAQATGGED